MSRNQEKANIMPQRGTYCLSIKKNEAPPHVQASVWDFFKLIMAILNRTSHHPQGHRKEGPLSKTRFLLLEIDVRELTKEREGFLLGPAVFLENKMNKANLYCLLTTSL